MAQRVDGHGLAAIGVVNKAVAVSIGIHERDNPAGGVVDLGRPEPVRVQRGRDAIRAVVNCGRDLAVGILDPDWRPPTSNVVVVRLSNGSTLATGLSSLSNTLVVMKPERVRRTNRIVGEVIASC